MKCQKVDYSSEWIPQIHELRNRELRVPLGLNLFDEDLAAEKDELFFISAQEDNLMSCMQFRKLNDTTLKLRQMATKDIYQGMGLGKKLVECGEQWAAENGYKTIELHARKTAQGFYKRLGYEKIGEQFMEVDLPHYKMVKTL